MHLSVLKTVLIDLYVNIPFLPPPPPSPVPRLPPPPPPPPPPFTITPVLSVSPIPPEGPLCQPSAREAPAGPPAQRMERPLLAGGCHLMAP